MKPLEEFIGRKEELVALDEVWARVQAGGPQWVLLLGDSGVGKTRLIHEFFRRRVAEVEGEPYWPAQLDANPATLRINPELADRPLKQDAMPWFWWGLRWPPPESRVGGGSIYCALLEQEAQAAITAHAGLWRRFLARKKHNKDFGRDLGLNLLNAAANFTPAGPLLEAGRQIFEIGQGTAEWAGLAGSDRQVNARDAVAQERRGGERATWEFLVSLFDAAPPHGRSRPVILVLDDTQWADGRTLAFTRDLFVDAKRNGWPLFVLATCWETDWKEQESALSSVRAENDPKNVAELFSQLGRLVPSPATMDFGRGENCRVLLLTRFENRAILRPLIIAAFPGLGPAAQEYLLRQADGNPRVLAEFLLQLEAWATSDWFVGDSRKSDLTPEGLRQLRRLPVKYESSVVQRIGRLEEQAPEIYRVLTLAAAQGLRFHGQLVVEIGAQLDCLAADHVLPALHRAETPLNVVSLSPGPAWPGQFKEQFAWRRLATSCKRKWPRADKILRQVLLDWFHRSAGKQTVNAADYLALLALHLRAPQVPEAEKTQWPRVMGELIAVLQQQGRPGTAAERAAELMKTLPPADDGWLRQFDRFTWFPVALALFEARSFDHLEAMTALVHVAPNINITGPEQLVWLELRAKAAHLREDFPSAIRWWREAIAQTEAEEGSDTAVNWTALRLRLGLAASLHMSTDGRRMAEPIYEKIASAVPMDQLRGLATGHLLLLGLASQGLASARCDAGALDEAILEMNRGCRMLAACQQRPDAGQEVTRALVDCLRQLGRWQQRHIGGAPKEAEASLRRAVRLQEELIRQTGSSTNSLVDLAGTQTWLARAVSRRSATEALSLVQEALATREEVLLRAGIRTDTRRGLALTLFCRGEIQFELQRFGPALDDFERARTLRLAVVAADRMQEKRWHDDLRMLVHATRKCGDCLRLLGRQARALVRLREALRHNQKNLRRQPREAEDLRTGAQLWEALGQLALDRGDRLRVRRCYQMAVFWLERLDRDFGLAAIGARDRDRLVLALRNLRQADKPANHNR